MASGRNLPHDLAQFVVESTLGLHDGFWGLLTNGATFESVRRRRTKPGQQVIRMHHEALTATEHVVNHAGALACAPRRGGTLRGVDDPAIAWYQRGRAAPIVISDKDPIPMQWSRVLQAVAKNFTEFLLDTD